MRRVNTDAKPKTPRRQRRAPPPPWLRPALRTTLTLAFLGSLGGGVAWAWHSGAVSAKAAELAAATLRLSAEAGLKVQQIYVEGRQRTPAPDILAALGTDRGDAILGLDLAEAHRRLEALPWVRSAAIERRLPSAVHVSIAERQPVALWQHQGKFSLVDDQGAVIVADVAGFGDLLLVVGEDAPAHAAELVAILDAEPEMRRRVVAAVRVGARRWNLTLDRIDGGIAVQLPEDDAEAAWRRLGELDRSQDLLARRVAVIDMRLPDRLVLRPAGADTALPRMRGAVPGKDA